MRFLRVIPLMTLPMLLIACGSTENFGQLPVVAEPSEDLVLPEKIKHSDFKPGGYNFY